MVIDFIRNMLGTAPTGYEFIEYIFAGLIAIMVIKFVMMLFSMVIKIGKRG
jgi:di/tricarboxylate transporter